jgi:hypothetical protein
MQENNIAEIHQNGYKNVSKSRTGFQGEWREREG